MQDVFESVSPPARSTPLRLVVNHEAGRKLCREMRFLKHVPEAGGRSVRGRAMTHRETSGTPLKGCFHQRPRDRTSPNRISPHHTDQRSKEMTRLITPNDLHDYWNGCRGRAPQAVLLVTGTPLPGYADFGIGIVFTRAEWKARMVVYWSNYCFHEGSIRFGLHWRRPGGRGAVCRFQRCSPG